MHIDAATPAGIPAAVACMVAAFAVDPVMGCFFHDSPPGRAEATARIVPLLPEARGASGIGGLVMGSDTRCPDWPANIRTRWDGFVASHPNLAGRLKAYETIVKSGEPGGLGFRVTAVGPLGKAQLWCLTRPHRGSHKA